MDPIAPPGPTGDQTALCHGESGGRGGFPAAVLAVIGRCCRLSAGRSLPGVAALLLLALAGYLNSFPGTFIWDDARQIAANPLVIAFDAKLIFTTDYCGQDVTCGTYRPLSVLSAALNRSLLGPEPGSFHAVNVLLHCVATILFYLNLRNLALGAFTSWLAAAYFCVHPIHTEVVNIVTFRSESLAAIGVLSALWAAQQAFAGRSLVVASGYLFAVLSKESGLVFLALLPLFDLFRLGSVAAVVKQRRFLYPLLAAITVVWYLVRRQVALSATVPPYLVSPADNPLVALDSIPGLLTALKAQVCYLQMLVYPAQLQAVYTGSSVGVVERVLSFWGVAVLVIPLVILALGVRGWRRRSASGLGIFAYVLSFSVTGNFLFPIPVLLAERLAYLPSAGYCLAVAGLVSWLWQNGPRVNLRRLALVAGIGYLGMLGVLLVLRNPDFSAPRRLAEVAVREDPENVRAWYFLGGGLWGEGRLEEAEHAYREGIRVDPSFPDTFLGLSQLRLSKGDPQGAIEAALLGVRAAAPGVLLPAHWVLARALQQAGRPREALEWLDRIPPAYPSRWDSCGLRSLVYEDLGDLRGASDCYRRELGPDAPPNAILRLVSLLQRQGLREEAAPLLARAEVLVLRELAREETAAALDEYGVVVALQGRYGEALRLFGRALSIDPASTKYRSHYEQALGFSSREGKTASPPP